MPKLPHCKQHWPAEEAGWLAPSGQAIMDYPGIKAQVVVSAQCKAANCSNRLIWGWFGVLEGDLRTDIYPISERKYQQEWLPRWKKDSIEPEQHTAFTVYVGEYTKTVCRPADSIFGYLQRLFRPEPTAFDVLRSMHKGQETSAKASTSLQTNAR